MTDYGFVNQGFMTAEQLSLLASSRYNAEFFRDERSGRTKRLSDWKQAIDKDHTLDAGDQAIVTFPDGKRERHDMNVQNIRHDSARNLMRLVGESMLSLVCDPEGLDDASKKRAAVRQAIGNGYSMATPDFGLLTGELSLDLCSAAASCYMLVYPDYDADGKPEPYPCYSRLLPKNVYPTWFQRKLIDLLNVERMPARAAWGAFPDLGLRDDPKATEMVEVIDFYTPDEVWKCLWYVTGEKVSGSGPYLAYMRPNPLGEVPIAWTRLEALKGDSFEGIFDQVSGIQTTLNNIAGLIMDSADRSVYSPLVKLGILEESIGPDGEILLDPSIPNARAERLQAPQPAGELFNLMGFLESNMRAASSLPAQRAGQNLPSIISAAGVQAVQGDLDSVVRWLLRHMSYLNTLRARLSAKVDEHFLDFEKPLIIPVGKQKTYKPSVDLAGNYRFRISYTGTGMGAANDAVMALQKAGGGIISKATARSQDPTILDPIAEATLIEEEQARQIVFQRMFTDPNTDFLRYASLINTGKTSLEAATILHEEMMAQQQALQAQAAQGQPGQPGMLPGAQGPPTPLQVQKGAIPGQTPPQGTPVGPLQVAPPPLESLLVNTPR